MMFLLTQRNQLAVVLKVKFLLTNTRDYCPASTATSSASSSKATAPAPTQDGIAPTCNKWHIGDGSPSSVVLLGEYEN